MSKLHFTGGARIGLAYASWPLASLTVNKERIVLNSGITKNLIFKVDDIISIEPRYGILLSQGIQIKHNNSKYNDYVIFWTFEDPDEIIEQVYEIGFFGSESTIFKPSDKTISENRDGFPINTTFTISMIIVIILLLLFDIIFYFQDYDSDVSFGTGIKMALRIIFFTSILTLISSLFRKIVLKKGRRVKEIKRYLYFAIIISGFMLFSFNLIYRL